MKDQSTVPPISGLTNKRRYSEIGGIGSHIYITLKKPYLGLGNGRRYGGGGRYWEGRYWGGRLYGSVLRPFHPSSGLCGDFDYNPDNDFMNTFGDRVDDPITMANSWSSDVSSAFDIQSNKLNQAPKIDRANRATYPLYIIMPVLKSLSSEILHKQCS